MPSQASSIKPTYSASVEDVATINSYLVLQQTAAPKILNKKPLVDFLSLSS